jgi:hypothetical protein
MPIFKILNYRMGAIDQPALRNFIDAPYVLHTAMAQKY